MTDMSPFDLLIQAFEERYKAFYSERLVYATIIPGWAALDLS